MRRLIQLVLTAALVTPAVTAEAADCLILLHGLARTSSSMEKAASAFEQHGFRVVNVDYPSRELPIEVLAPLAIERGIEQCARNDTVHFVTHSLGGILVRYYLERNEIEHLGRVVMLAPPNQGSEVVDRLRDVPGFVALNGPAGLQLGTGDGSVPTMLGPVDFELGVIAGTRTVNPILSLFLPDPDDGKVSVENTKVEGMSDFIDLPHSHPFIMQASAAIAQALSFVESGHFARGDGIAR
jgi:pimeloyl-ACP methyl ester carboxylesterase